MIAGIAKFIVSRDRNIVSEIRNLSGKSISFHVAGMQLLQQLERLS